MRSIFIGDTTLRDGEQAPGFSMTPNEKLRLAHQIEALGSNMIDGGFPNASEGEFKAVNMIAKEIRGAQVGGLARVRQDDIDRLAKALEPAADPVVLSFVSTSDLHLEQKLRWTRQQALDAAAKYVAYAHKLVGNVSFAAEDATRSEPAFVAEMFSTVIEAGAKTVVIADTVGYILPNEMTDLVRYLLANVKGIDKVMLAVHCHDDLGLAVANSMAAIQAGAGQIDCTINGIGERAGNAALEEVVMIMKTRNLGFETRINPKEIFRTSELLTKITGQRPQANKAIVGGNAFAHEAGIHQAGILKNPLTYEVMTPESIGAERQMVLGKHSGRHGLKARLEELGHRLEDEAKIQKLYERFTEIADAKKIIHDEDLLQALRRVESHEIRV